MSNKQLLQITGEPNFEDSLRRNRLRWFGHANRMIDEDSEPLLIKKIMFSFYGDSKRPRNVGIFKRWEDRIKEDLDILKIHNWRRATLDCDSWRKTINQYTLVKPPAPDILDIVQQVKQRAVQRRTAALLPPPPKATEVIPRNNNKTYTCPNCKKEFKPQGVTKHVKSCAMKWCRKNGIK